MEDQPSVIQTAPRHLPVLLDIAQLPQKVAEFRRIVSARAIAQALDEIDRAFTEALVDPLLAQGAPPEEVAIAVQQVAVIKEAVKESLLKRLGAKLEYEREAARMGAERARRSHPGPPVLSEPVVTTVASAVGPIAAKPDRPILPLHAAR